MKFPVFFLLGIFGVLSAEASPGVRVRSVRDSLASSSKPGGGTDCAACTVVVGILEQVAQVDGPSRVFSTVCGKFKDLPLRKACEYLGDLLGDVIVRGLEAKESPDHICRSLRFCTSDQCELFPRNAPPPPLNNNNNNNNDNNNSNNGGGSGPAMLARLRAAATASGAAPWLVGESPLQWIKDLINRFANDHNPLVDLDGDGFSTHAALRGYDWAGRDCDDEDGSVHPGSRVLDPSKSPAVDHDCNGIAGVDSTGKSFQEQFCSGTGMRMTGLLGDSAGAHFELPPEWFNVSMWHDGTFDGALTRLENEFDLPMRSFTTGFVGNQTTGPVGSLYLEQVKRNQCNRNFYINRGVNGERSGSMKNLVQQFPAKPDSDIPHTIVLELIGNDVCHSKWEVSTMTSVEEFRANTIFSLQYLDKILPKGSAVLLIGLARGTLLWEALKDRTHPVGVKYPDFYNYLNCLEISPCAGWMNTNATTRNNTEAHAQALTAVLPELVSNSTLKFNNIEIDFYPFPMNDISKFYSGPLYELIEPVDGFHPNQLANFYISKQLIKYFETNHPSWLSPVNPNNQAIIDHFGSGLPN